METGLIFVLAEVIVGYVVSRLVIYIDFRYYRAGSDDSLEVDIFLFNKVLLYRMKVPLIKMINDDGVPWIETKVITKDGMETADTKREQRFTRNALRLYLFHPRRLWHMLKAFRYYMRIYRRFMIKLVESITCERFYWKTTYGSEDADVTGYMVGMLWAVKGTTVTGLKRRFPFSSEPVVKVKPIFGKSCFEVNFRCIFSLRLGKVINASTAIFILKRKGVTGSE